MTLPLLFVWLFTLLSPPVAQDGGPALSAQAGFDGLYEESTAIPMVVTIQNNGAEIEGEIRVSAFSNPASDALIYSAPISLPTGSDKRIPLVVHFPTFGSALTVRLMDGEQVIAETRTNRLRNVGRDELFYGVLTPDPGRLAFLETIPGARADAAVAYLNLNDLPEVSSAWNALDVLVLDDTDTSRLTAGQVAAMRAWIESGGQLVVTGGPGGPQTAAGVADLLPVTVRGVESIADLSALGDTLSDHAGEPLEASGLYPVTISDLVSGETLIEQDGLPLLARRALGRGTVYFLALDPKAAPLAGWAGGDQLWEEIVANAPVLPPWASGVRDGYAATQAVSYIPGLRLPSIWQLLLFLLLYTLIIGPINFLVLRRMNRRELAWITIPVLVLLFSGITFLTGFRTRGNTTTLNVMSVAFGSVEAEQLATQTVLGLYSPRRATYDVTLPYNSAAFPFRQGFGSLIGVSNLDTIDRASDLVLSRVRADTSEVATFIVESHQPRPPITATANLSAEGDAVEVTVRNGTADTLENAVIIYGDDIRSLGNLAAGEERSVRISLPSSSAASLPPSSPTSMFPPGYMVPDPLVTNPGTILGTTDYFRDPVAYPRWQLIQSHYTGEFDPTAIPDPTEIVTLGGWLAGSAQEVGVSGETDQSGQTLLLLEVPVR